jgi:hypothetical protein
MNSGTFRHAKINGNCAVRSFHNVPQIFKKPWRESPKLQPGWWDSDCLQITKRTRPLHSRYKKMVPVDSHVSLQLIQNYSRVEVLLWKYSELELKATCAKRLRDCYVNVLAPIPSSFSVVTLGVCFGSFPPITTMNKFMYRVRIHLKFRPLHWNLLFDFLTQQIST